MKIKFINDKIILYLRNDQIQTDFNDLDKLEDYFKKLFSKLKRLINITFSGFYEIDLYLDETYGAVIELKKEAVDYLDYVDNQIDMHITIHKTTILYQIDDILNVDYNSLNIYNFRNKYYLEIDNINKNINILEYTNPIYKTDDIITYGKKIIKMI